MFMAAASSATIGRRVEAYRRTGSCTPDGGGRSGSGRRGQGHPSLLPRGEGQRQRRDRQRRGEAVRAEGRRVGLPTCSSMVSPAGKAQWFPHSFVVRVPEAGSPASVATRVSPRVTRVLVPSGSTSHSLKITVASTPVRA